MNESQPQRRWYHLTPGRFVFALLAVECLLWLSERFGWLGWHKGYAVLTGVAVVAVGTLLVFLWFLVCLLFRWRFQFSIRSLLVFVVVAALPCGWLASQMKEAERQKAAAEAIMKLDGLAWYDHQYWESSDGTKIVHVDARPSGPVSLQSLLGRDFFNSVVAVVLDGTKVTDADLEHIEVLAQIQELDLERTPITDAGLGNLKSLTRLQRLNLGQTQVSDAGLNHLKGMRQLRNLDLDDTQVTDTGLELLIEMPQLQGLGLYHTRVTDAGLEHLKKLTHLHKLILDGKKITDAGLEHLKGLNQLEILYLESTQVTAAGVAKLQQALPNCKITRCGRAEE
jgi:hypothetical protein